MSPDNINPGKQATKEETQGSNGRKTAASRPPDPQPLNCPRCDSSNTKFCYYNNYSLTQPRHFCKTCRRYWTKGGALRNVPIGGGCRKTKKIKSSSCSRLSGIGDHHHSSGESSDQIGSGLKFFHGTLSPAMDFQLGHGLSSSSSLIPRLQYPAPNGIYTQFSSFGDNSISATSSASATTIDPVGSSFMGFNFPLKQQGESGGGGAINQGMNVHTNLASSIESLSCMNQDLHWKLQQQRLSMLFGGGGGDDDHQNKKDTNFLENQSQRLQPILFQNLEISRKDNGGSGGGGGDTATEWFFDSSYAPGSAAQVVTNHGSNAGASDHNNTSNNWNNGIPQAWNNNDLHQYGSNLP